MADAPRTIVIFDGECVLCNGWIQFTLRHERDHEIYFATAQSPAGLRIAQSYGVTPRALELSYLVVKDGRPLFKSAASFALLEHFKCPLRWLRILRIIPPSLRDALYDVVARNRYQWFGRQTCSIPSQDQRHRFLQN